MGGWQRYGVLCGRRLTAHASSNSCALPHTQHPARSVHPPHAQLALSGLAGGHSGLQIHAGLGNAVQLMAGSLAALLAAAPGARLVELRGGEAVWLSRLWLGCVWITHKEGVDDLMLLLWVGGASVILPTNPPNHPPSSTNLQVTSATPSPGRPLQTSSSRPISCPLRAPRWLRAWLRCRTCTAAWSQTCPWSSHHHQHHPHQQPHHHPPWSSRAPAPTHSSVCSPRCPTAPCA